MCHRILHCNVRVVHVRVRVHVHVYTQGHVLRIKINLILFGHYTYTYTHCTKAVQTYSTRTFQGINAHMGAQDVEMRHSGLSDTKTDVAESQQTDVDVLDVVREQPCPRARGVRGSLSPPVRPLLVVPRPT